MTRRLAFQPSAKIKAFHILTDFSIQQFVNIHLQTTGNGVVTQKQLAFVINGEHRIRQGLHDSGELITFPFTGHKQSGFYVFDTLNATYFGH